MIEKRYDTAEDMTSTNPLRQMTTAEFAALGGGAVAFIRSISGSDLAIMIRHTEFEDEAIYQLVMSADGTPLMVGDTRDVVSDWIGENKLGVVSLH